MKNLSFNANPSGKEEQNKSINKLKQMHNQDSKRSLIKMSKKVNQYVEIAPVA